MKKIINGKRYDTDTAELVGSATAGDGFRHFDERLFKTPRSGAFFLAGQGGPMTIWAERIGDGYRDGSGIRPLTREDALVWAEAHLAEELIEKYFGDLVQDA